MKDYEELIMKITYFSFEDAIRTSGEANGEDNQTDFDGWERG